MPIYPLLYYIHFILLCRLPLMSRRFVCGIVDRVLTNFVHFQSRRKESKNRQDSNRIYFLLLPTPTTATLRKQFYFISDNYMILRLPACHLGHFFKLFFFCGLMNSRKHNRCVLCMLNKLLTFDFTVLLIVIGATRRRGRYQEHNTSMTNTTMTDAIRYYGYLLAVWDGFLLAFFSWFDELAKVHAMHTK